MKERKPIYGVAINDYEGSTRVDGKIIPAYVAWHSMLRRCYSPKCQDKAKAKAYKGCSVSQEWLYFSNFKAWHDENYHQGWEIDKDILIPGNKTYSPEACRYVPSYLNSLLCDSRATRGELPIGVSEDHGCGYLTRCSNGNYHTVCHHHRTLEAAVADYQVIKSEVAKIQVERARRDGVCAEVCIALLERRW